jgi:hypothetical protein
MSCGVGQQICWNNIVMYVSNPSTKNVNSRQIKKAAERTTNTQSCFFLVYLVNITRHDVTSRQRVSKPQDASNLKECSARISSEITNLSRGNKKA